MKKIKLTFVLCLSLLTTINTTSAAEILEGVNDNPASFNTAQNKFALANTSAAHSDFKQLIENASEKDFYLLNKAIYLAEYGFFDLTDTIFSKIDNYDIAQNYINDIKNFYYPAQRLEHNELIYLAEAYSNIKYNNYAQEAVLDIVNNNILLQNSSDYTYYILALGYFETKDYLQALNYISLANSRNPNNINYKITKFKILLELNQHKKAEKLLRDIKKINLNCKELKNKISALEQFYLYKVEKNETLKNYHLGYYYLLEGKNSAAQRVLISNISNNKKLNGEIYNLLARSYLTSDVIKSNEYAQKAQKNYCKSPLGYYAQAIDKWNHAGAKQALRALNKGQKIKKIAEIENMIAEILHKTNRTKQANKLLTTLVKKYPCNYKALYYASFYAPNPEAILKQALSFNVLYSDAYYQLALIYANRENFTLAKEYLNNVKYICGTNFKYYYYLSCIEALQGNAELAAKYEAMCKDLEPNYRDIIDKELQIEE